MKKKIIIVGKGMIECVLRNGQIRKSQWEFFFFLEKEMFAVVVT